jgi:hypothetical protein
VEGLHTSFAYDVIYTSSLELSYMNYEWSIGISQDHGIIGPYGCLGAKSNSIPFLLGLAEFKVRIGNQMRDLQDTRIRIKYSFL